MLEVEDEVLPQEEASSARVLGDENGVSGRRCSSASSCGRKVKGSSAGASGRIPSSVGSIFYSRKNLPNFFCRMHFAVYWLFFLKIMSELAIY